jgi:DUF971 family protein
MSSQAIFLEKIYQTDNYTFTIEWSDGIVTNYRLGELQRKCPCAACIDNKSKKITNDTSSYSDVRAIRLFSVGRYALRIDFTRGCSQGIYSFDFLRECFKNPMG